MSILSFFRKLVLGVVNNPMTGHLYHAVRGKGAFVNGDTALRTSGVKELKDAMVLMEIPIKANEEKQSTAINNITSLMVKAHSIRCPGMRWKKNYLFINHRFL